MYVCMYIYLRTRCACRLTGCFWAARAQERRACMAIYNYVNYV